MYAALVGTAAFDLDKAESARVEAPEFESVEEFFAWQRGLYRTAAAKPLPAREVVVDVRGRQLELLVYSLPPLRIITPFGVVVLLARPDGGD